MSRDDTARITSGCDGKRCSIFLDCPNPGSLVEKKKFSSTTGLRSTKTATSTNKTTVKASISQCAPGSFFQFGSRTFIDRNYAIISAGNAAPRATLAAKTKQFRPDTS